MFDLVVVYVWFENFGVIISEVWKGCKFGMFVVIFKSYILGVLIFFIGLEIWYCIGIVIVV